MDYTASIVCNDRSTHAFSGNDFWQLVVTLLGQMESENNFSTGNIKSNHTGKVLHSCQKVASE